MNITMPRRGSARVVMANVSHMEYASFKELENNISEREHSAGELSRRAYRAAYVKWIGYLGNHTGQVSSSEYVNKYNVYCIPLVFEKNGKCYKYEKVEYEPSRGAEIEHQWHPNHVIFNYPLWLSDNPNWFSNIKRRMDDEAVSKSEKYKKKSSRF